MATLQTSLEGTVQRVSYNLFFQLNCATFSVFIYFFLTPKVIKMVMPMSYFVLDKAFFVLVGFEETLKLVFH